MSILKSEYCTFEYYGTYVKKYIEFEYLAVVDSPDVIRFEGSCSRCRYKEGPLSVCRLFYNVEEAFKMELDSVVSSLVDCFSLVYTK